MIGLLVLEAGGKLTAAGCLEKAAAGCAQSKDWDRRWGTCQGVLGISMESRRVVGVEVGFELRRVVAAPCLTVKPRTTISRNLGDWPTSWAGAVFNTWDSDGRLLSLLGVETWLGVGSTPGRDGLKT